MSANELQLTNVINISVSATQAGIGEYNTSNIGLFTRDPEGGGFGSLGYKLYLEPTEVGTDFGTSSATYKMANAIFSQKPNILLGGGYLAVIPFADTAPVVAVQHIAFSSVPASGAYKLNIVGDVTASIAFGDNAAAVQTAIRTLTGFGSVTVAGDTTAGFDVTCTGISGPAELLTVSANSLQDVTPVNVDVTVTTTTAGTVTSTETLDAAITRTKDLVQYFGLTAAEVTSEADGLAAAAVVQPLNKIQFLVSRTSADVAPGGYLDLLTTGGFDHSRGLYYGGATDLSAILMLAAYMGRALSTNFDGSNTTQTMQLKDLIGVQPDPTMTQTIQNLCDAAGADTYVSLQGVPKVLCSGANRFYDQVYNEQWFVGALQVAGFNYLAQASTKIPQTEQGMSGLKGAYRSVCQQSSTNQYVAPGTWNSPVTFGNQEDFLFNIAQVGYYIYSVPISQQSQASRAGRVSPLIQIAIKEAGAIHSSDVVVNINP
jgi:hypothetical protein